MGLKDQLSLPTAFNDDADRLTDEQRKELGITRLPLTFQERQDVINSAQGQPLRHFFGEELIKNILLVNQVDFDYFASADLEDEVKLLLERY